MQNRLKLRAYKVFQKMSQVELNELIAFELVLGESPGHQLLCKGKQYIFLIVAKIKIIKKI